MSDTTVHDFDLTEPVRDGPTLHELIREDIVSGRLRPNERLKVSDLAERHGVSTSPVREALQVLRGEGFVVISPNRGARVRPIDEDFIRDIYEVETVIEPYLMRHFLEMVTEEQIAELERIQARIEENDFKDVPLHAELDEAFHLVTYRGHYNKHIFGLWQKHREILGAIAGRYPHSLSRRKAVIEEHRALIQAIRHQEVEQACAIICRHAAGSGRHTIEQLRAHGGGPR